ncbi:MAG: tetraacyldisaccharide 4'-kinase [Candidatus Eisenbacteria bacterium]|nr:tetraacyldisaccharide 4'-kinase [Candidatus Eisenbacteria bacterium]
MLRRWAQRRSVSALDAERKGEPWPIAAGLRVLSGLYGGVVRIRNAQYDAGRRRAAALPWPVISVGGLTAGGSGKTPAVVLVAHELGEIGLRPLILIRGYGAPRPVKKPLLVDAAEPGAWRAAGDEAVLLSQRCPEAAVAVHPNRARAAHHAAQQVSFDAVLLDDGFQHRRLERDLDLVVWDASRRLGSGRLLPHGDLREPWSSLRRADAVLLSRYQSADRRPPPSGLPALPSLRLGWRLGRFTPLGGGDDLEPAALSGRRLAAAAGIARPWRFLRDLEAIGLDVVGHELLPDHSPLAPGDLRRWKARRAAEDWEALVITEKDAVRWKADLEDWDGEVLVARGAAHWWTDTDRDFARELLREAVQRQKRRARFGRTRRRG